MFSSSLTAFLALTGVGLVSAFPGRQPPPSQSKRYDMPLEWNPLGFVGTVSMGTPAQELKAFVDWTWIGQYVLTTLCNGSTTATYECLHPAQELFNQSLSTTFTNQSELYPNRNWNPNHFFFYQDLSVQYASDIHTVGPATSRITIMAADMHFTVPYPYPFAGVYGLSPVFKSDNASTQSPFYQAWVNGVWPEPTIGFHYCYNGSADTTKAACNGHDAIQTLGGYRKELIKDDLTWYDNIVFPLVNTVDFEYDPPLYNYWALPLTEMTLGDERQAINRTTGAGAIFDHASYGRGAALSENAYNRLISIAGGKPIQLEDPPNNGNQSWVQIDCDKTDKLPPIKYQFGKGTKRWEIVPRNYVEDLGNGVCVLNIRTLGEGDMVAGNFGETFAKDKYIVFDFEKLKVGVGSLRTRRS
ncbi:MAG: hypothetical protein M1817_000832 [Caeruleum heppii]|nr:MAG: hypothetical protein M1817_000832 [Caeruleum heppii]